MRKCDSGPLWTLPPATLLLALVSALVLTACGDFWRNVPPRPAATDDPTLAATPYPSINNVPARPQLSYPLEQRREIAEGLVADRTNARYAGDALRRENDRPALAGQPTPLPPAAPRGPRATPSQQGELALAYVEEALAREADDGTLDDFLERLQQQPIGPGPRSAERAAAAAAAKQAQEDRAGRPAPASTPAPSSSNESAAEEVRQQGAADVAPTTVEPAAGSIEAPIEVGEVQVEATEVPVEPATAGRVAGAGSPAPTTTAARISTKAPGVDAPAAPRLPMAILFAADDSAIAVRDTAKLEALAHANDDTPQLFVVGNGPRPGLALERARSVAALLVRAGIPAERLVIEMGGESDVVVVYEPDGDTS